MATATALQGNIARWQFDLLGDGVRNRAYDQAIRSQLARLIRQRKREQTQAWWGASTSGKAGQAQAVVGGTRAASIPIPCRMQLNPLCT
eukprot:COSAG01_NODE_3297_length_6298_cov_2.316341_6_plen_89_part_00